MDWKKYGAISVLVILLAAVVVLAFSNADRFSEEEVNESVNLAVVEATAPLDIEIVTLKEALVALDEEKSEIAEGLTALEETVAELEAQIEAIAQAEVDAEIEAEQEAESEEAKEVIDDIALGDAVEFKLDDGDLAKFIDDEIEFDGDDYDVREEFSGNTFNVIAINGYGYDEEFSGEPYFIVADEGALEYRYIFDDVIDMTDISDEEPLEIVFLGQPMKIVSADSDELKVEFGVELLLDINEPYEYEGKDLTLMGVGDGEAFIIYNDDTESIDEGQTKDVGGIDVKVIDVFESNIGEGYGFAKIVIGSEVEKTMESDEEYLDNEDFLFYIESSGNDLEALVILSDFKADELDDDYAPLALGESIDFLGFLTVEFAELTEVDYVDFEVYFDDFDAEDDLVADENGVVLEAGKAVIEIDDEEFEEVYFMASGIYYENDDGDFTKATDSSAFIVFEDTEMEVILNANYLVIKTGEGRVKIATNLVENILGTEEEDAEAGDVLYMGNNFGTLEYDLLTGTGLVILDIENNADNDEVKFIVPSENVEAVVTVY